RGASERARSWHLEVLTRPHPQALWALLLVFFHQRPHHALRAVDGVAELGVGMRNVGARCQQVKSRREELVGLLGLFRRTEYTHVLEVVPELNVEAHPCWHTAEVGILLDRLRGLRHLALQAQAVLER